MEFIQSDLGQRRRGDVLEVTLTSGANVRLLDSANFSRYRRGQRHTYHGGLATRSPVRLEIPRSGHWYGVVDMQGLRGSTRASFRIVRTDISPDGSKLVVIAFHGGAGTPDTVVFLTSFGGLLASYPACASAYPSWLPDDSTVAMYSWCDPRSLTIGEMAESTGDVHELL